MKKFLFWLGIALVIIGVACVTFALIMQTVVSVEKFGFAIDSIFVPHWSAWFFMGVFPLFAGWILAGCFKD